MDSPSFTSRPRVLVAPLDWGLGHATRCVPLIRALVSEECEVILAGEGKTEALLRAEFPQLEVLPLKGYNINYGKSGWELFAKLLMQVPAIIETMDEEHEWLKVAVKEHRIDAVISDNRYGLYHEETFSVFITHQLLVKTTLGATADELLQKLQYQYINAFTECWVPDIESAPGLAADLSHPKNLLEIPLHYLGPLSRLKKGPEVEGKHLLVLLSGPEPQRTLLEEALLLQLERYTEPVVFLRGLPGGSELPAVRPNIQILNHLPAGELEEVISEAHIVVSRCGYSTVMDLLSMGKKSILIPTPGQTEQEYLARHLMEQNLALCIPQSKLKLMNALELADCYNYAPAPVSSADSLINTVQQFVAAVKERKTRTTVDSNKPTAAF